MDFVKFEIPEGPEWELLIAAVVVLIGPLIVERLRIPGLVGLLFGGMIVGPNVLGLTDPQGGIVSQLGAIGLLYLMFMAGLDLDLNVFAKVRNQAVTFALMTFFGPFALGFALGATIGYELGAAALLGSVFASHTLVTYPLIRSHGLATNRAVAITVGATVITDTLALIVLAVVSGQASGDASGIELISQVAIGLLILSFTCFVDPAVDRSDLLRHDRARSASSATRSPSPCCSPVPPSHRRSASNRSSAPSSPASPSTGWCRTRARSWSTSSSSARRC